MQIHEITLKNKTVNEGLIGAVADVAGRSIMQKYGGQQGREWAAGKGWFPVFAACANTGEA